MFFCRCDGDTIGRARDLTMRVVMCFVMIVKYCANKITTRRVLRRDLVGMDTCSARRPPKLLRNIIF